MAKKITACEAFRSAVEKKMKFKKRGYGERIIFINECPDCGGTGTDCPTCGNDPDDASDKVKVGKFWYRRLK